MTLRSPFSWQNTRFSMYWGKQKQSAEIPFSYTARIQSRGPVPFSILAELDASWLILVLVESTAVSSDVFLSRGLLNTCGLAGGRMFRGAPKRGASVMKDGYLIITFAL